MEKASELLEVGVISSQTVAEINVAKVIPRQIIITYNGDHTVEVISNDLFIAREYHKILRSLTLWYRLKKKEFRLEQNRKG